MTNIYLYGILAKKFGNFFKASINSATSALRLIDANKNNFLIELKKLSTNNYNYVMLCDGKIIENENQLNEKRKIDNIYIMPLMMGSGEAIAALILGITVEAAKESATAIVLAGVINAVIGAAISFGVSLLTGSSSSYSAPASPDISVGGSTTTLEAKGKSFIFSNSMNVASQGEAIPVGYGHSILSSKIIGMGMKNYLVNTNNQLEFELFKDSSIFFENLTK